MPAEENPVIPFVSAKPARALDQPNNKISLYIEIAENDVRARQFACHLTIGNATENPITILAISYRLGRGVSVEKTENASFLDMKEEYERLKDDVKIIIRS